ncbi:MAG: aminotransferase class V-fold PLP-dependent enzyme [Hespellia sp.]|nr:aminotransferase class V-fold PLP-dependent enzyme [Hespellia sp.]
MIYMDNAATTLYKPAQVTEAVIQAMSSLGNAGRGASNAALNAARTIFEAREKLCRFFHAENPRQIVFTNNSTESLNIAIQGLINPGDHVITTVLEHNSVLRPLYEREEAGAELTILGCDEKGNIVYEEMEAAIQENTKAIVCTHASNLTGNMIDVEHVGRIAKKYQLLLIVDASQTAGVYPIDVQKMNIDVLCFTGHKSLLGPQGTGGMCVREGLSIRPLKRGGSGIDTYNRRHPSQMPTALEAGTLNGHGIAGLSAAISYLEEIGIERIRQKELALMWQFYHGVRELPGVQVYGDFKTENRCPIVSLNLMEEPLPNAFCLTEKDVSHAEASVYDSAEVSDELLTTYQISTRAGGHCAPLMHQALGTEGQGAVRFSFSYHNTEAEVQMAIRAIQEIL